MNVNDYINNNFCNVTAILINHQLKIDRQTDERGGNELQIKLNEFLFLIYALNFFPSYPIY